MDIVKRKKTKKMSKKAVNNFLKILALLIGILIGIGTIKSNKFDLYASKNESINNDGTSMKNYDEDENQENNNKENKQENNQENNCDSEKINNDIGNEPVEDKNELVNTATGKQEIVYRSCQEDMFADNAREVQNMLRKWSYLREDGKKIVYLTFDDGPSSKVTPEILQVLKENDIKATFFVLGSVVERSDISKEILKEIVLEGHAIGNHGYSHDYKVLYPGRIADPTAFINDMNKSEDILKSVLGDNFSTNVIRMPGGHMSWKTKALDPVLEENGLSYIDWNSLNGDAEGKTRTSEQLVSRLKSSIDDLAGNDDVLVVLMHDTNAKETTAQSLQTSIDYLKSLGYEFRTLK